MASTQKTALTSSWCVSLPLEQLNSLCDAFKGAMSFGAPGSEGARVDNVKDLEAVMDLLLKHGHRETMLGKINWQEKGILMETKILPFYPILPDVTAAHSPEGLRESLMMSLKAWTPSTQLEIWYLHAPDRSVPYEVTLKAIDELHREGHFQRWGISHYMSWEVAEMVGICKQHGYVQPAVYQGIYNAIHRDVEPELFPALRKFGIAFYEFNPRSSFLWFISPLPSDHSIPSIPPISRLLIPRTCLTRYWKPEFFDALARCVPSLTAHGLTMAEVALRWVSHHSLMRRACGDAIIIGGSTLHHIEEVLAALDTAWASVKANSSTYYKAL
ncbi:Aldo/keto reductase [Mycena leptocephala]|nr:Aldo/keto reductase [Mycena leptocephala]